MEVFKDQVCKYHSEAFSDFRRMNLAYAFQDLVKGLSRENVEEVNESVQSILDLQAIDSDLMKVIGYDLLETSVKLHLLFGTRPAKVLYEFSKTIAFRSSPKEVLIQINALIEIFMESPEGEYEFLSNLGDESKNVFKTVVTFYLSIVISRMDEAYLKIAVGELSIYLKLLESDYSTCEVLGLGIIDELLEGIRSRNLALKVSAQKEILEFLLRFLVLYEKTAKFIENCEKVVGLINHMFGNLEKIVEICEKLKVGTGAEGVLILAGKVCSLLSAYKLPMVYSGSKRLQVMLISSIKGAEKFPELFLQVFSHTVEYLSESSFSVRLSVNFFPYKNLGEFMIGLIEICAKLPKNAQKLKAWGMFLAFMEKLEKDELWKNFDMLIKNLKWDKAKAMLLDWVRKVYRAGEVNTKNVVGFISKALEADVFEEFPETLQAAILLFKVLDGRGEDESGFEKVKIKLKGISKTLKKVPQSFVHDVSLMHLREIFGDNL